MDSVGNGLRRLRDYVFALETLQALAFARARAFFPFRWSMRGEEPSFSAPLRDNPWPKGARARAVRRSILKVAERLPWRSTCLVRALASRTLLRRRGIDCVIHFGVMRSDGKLIAHAWCEADGGVVCGGDETEKYTHLAGFRRASS
jgi:hypothetical protein